MCPPDLTLRWLLLTTLLFRVSSLPAQRWIKALPCESLEDDLASIQCNRVIEKLDEAAGSVDILRAALTRSFGSRKGRIFRRFGPGRQVTFGLKFLLRLDRDLSHMAAFLRTVRDEGGVQDRELENSAARQLRKAQRSVRALGRLMTRHSKYPLAKEAASKEVLHPEYLSPRTQQLRRIRYFFGCHEIAKHLRRAAAAFRTKQQIAGRPALPKRSQAPSAAPETGAKRELTAGNGEVPRASTTSEVALKTSAAAKPCSQLRVLLIPLLLLLLR